MTHPEPEPGPDIEPPEQAPRRYPSTIGGLLYLLGLGGVLAGLGVAVVDDWRVGVRVFAVSVLFVAACRLVMPSRQAGMLAVRHRATDVAMLVAVGVVMLFLAGSIPNQPV